LKTRTKKHDPYTDGAPPLWVVLIVLPFALALSPIGTGFFIWLLGLCFEEALFLIALQVCIFLTLALFCGGEDEP
jgi:hypothetical protein